jgi:hypothetical protein
MGFDEWNLIAGLQALTIYILLRSFDSDAVSVAFDVSLMHTMSVSASLVSVVCQISTYNHRIWRTN